MTRPTVARFPMPDEHSPYLDDFTIDPASLAQHLALRAELQIIEHALQRTTKIYRGDGLPLTHDETEQARHLAHVAVALTSQGLCRAVSEATAATLNASLVAARAEVLAVHEDHSRADLIIEAIDRFLQKIQSYNLPLAFNGAIAAVVGSPRARVLSFQRRICERCDHTLITVDEIQSGLCELCTWTDQVRRGADDAEGGTL